MGQSQPGVVETSTMNPLRKTEHWGALQGAGN